MTSRRRVAVTGLGVVSPFGLGVEAARLGLLEGRDCSAPVGGIDPLDQRGRRACQVPDDPLHEALRALLPRPSRWHDRATLLLILALEEALRECGVEPADFPGGPRLVLGTTLGGMESGLRYHREALGGKPRRMENLLDYLALSQPVSVLLRWGLTGRPWVVSNACASGTSALGLAFRVVRTGRDEMAVAVGLDPMSAFTFWGFNALRLVSSDRCRPFDSDRTGLVLGEGAAALVLEERERALARGAPILGEVLGYGETNDAYHPTHPDPAGRGARLAMERALQDARVPPSSVDYVNAHGTGTQANDEAEARALKALFGDHADAVPVSSSKGNVGHCLGAAGALEAAFALICLRDGFLPQTANLERPDPKLPLRHIQGAPLRKRAYLALSNSFGFGGMNATVVLSGPELAAEVRR